MINTGIYCPALIHRWLFNKSSAFLWCHKWENIMGTKFVSTMPTHSCQQYLSQYYITQNITYVLYQHMYKQIQVRQPRKSGNCIKFVTICMKAAMQVFLDMIISTNKQAPLKALMNNITHAHSKHYNTI